MRRFIASIHGLLTPLLQKTGETGEQDNNLNVGFTQVGSGSGWRAAAAGK